MPPKRNTSSMDLSRASPVIQQPTNIGNDPGSSTKGVGTTSAGLKSKRQPLVRSGGSGSNSGSQQSLLGFSSRKNASVTPEKKKVSGLKRKVEEVGDEGVVNPETTVHPLFARKAEEPMVLEPVQSVDVDSKEGVRSATIEGISGVPTGWDPLLLTGSQPTKTMEQNLTLDNVHSSSLDLTPDEQAEQTEALQPGTHRNRGLAFRKAMLSADQRIKAIRETKPPIGKGKTGAGAKGKTGKGKGGLDPNDKRWSKVYKESWKAMGGDHIAPSTLFLPFPAPRTDLTPFYTCSPYHAPNTHQDPPYPPRIRPLAAIRTVCWYLEAGEVGTCQSMGIGTARGGMSPSLPHQVLVLMRVR